MSRIIYLGLMLSIMMVMASSANVESLVGAYSLPCQMMFKEINTTFNTTESCQTGSLIWALQYYVGAGFCTESEFNNLTSEVCNMTVSQTTFVSDARLNFYEALNKTSSKCQNMAFSCIISSAVSIVSKQQEQFCSLLNLNINGLSSESCFISLDNTGCTQPEANDLKKAACDVNSTRVDRTFSNAVLSTSSKCQSQMSTCTMSALEVVIKGKYCDVMYFKDGDVTMETCVKTDNACTSAEFDKMKLAACSSPAINVVATLSPPCQRVLQDSNYQSQNSTETCASEQLTWRFQYLVRAGFCTEMEFNNLTSTLCGKVYSQTTAVSDARKNFYVALNKTSSDCQYKMYTCILSSAVFVVYKHQEQFCSLLNVNSSGSTSEYCLVSADNTGCTQTEFNQLKTAACGMTSTSVDQTFSKAVLGTTSTCQGQLSSCTAINLVVMEKYCDAMNFKDSSLTTEACLKTGNACTAAESDKLKFAACSHATITARSFTSLCISLVVILFIHM